MSRNLGGTRCHRANCDDTGNHSVVLEETPRQIRSEEAGVYFPEYKGMIVANAHCTICEAKYLAWVANAPFGRLPDGRRDFFDLSWRSTFNDEPGPDDLPPYVGTSRDFLAADKRVASALQTLEAIISTLQEDVELPRRSNWVFLALDGIGVRLLELERERDEALSELANLRK